MASVLSSDSDPFADPIIEEGFVETLVVGRNASLTLGTDSLIVLGTSDTSRFFVVQGN